MTKFNFPAAPIRESKSPQLPADIRLTTPEQNFGSCSVAREINALYEDVVHNHVIWQPDVYAEARAIADQFGIKRIIDVGCGNGEKLSHFFPSALYQTAGLDFHGSILLARSTYPDANFIECDLNSIYDLDRVFGEIDSTEPVLLIMSDVIEHIPDPRLLLAHLRSVLLKHPSSRLVLSTPDRILLDKESYGTYPVNHAHLREWSHEELAGFCQAAGFEVERSGHTRSNQFDERYSTIYIQLRCDLAQYIAFLRAAGLLHGHVLPSHLLLTSEYAGLHSTGGIGTFVAEQRLAYRVENTLCLYIGQENGLDAELFPRLKLIKPRMLLDEVDLSLPVEEIVLKATLQLLFFFPNLTKIEYADYQGLGCRLAQAKRAALFPPSVKLVVHCHGGTHYLENANQTWLNLEPQIREWAKHFSTKQHALFLGRGVHYPIALEGALKLKEISYIHAEAYPAGELKHGPLALVDTNMPVVVIAPNDALLEKVKSNMQEVRARGGELFVFADLDSHFTASEGVHVIRTPRHAGVLSPIVHSIPVQLLAYHAALLKGTDVDKPRNLAKSVTVE